MPSPLRFGLVGAGRIAQAYAQAFAVTSNAKLIAVADVCTEAAESLAATMNCRSYASYQQMTQEDLDAVVICSPPATHAEIGCYFLMSGVPVLCEKPLSTNFASAQKMLATASIGNTVFTMASKFRYVSDVVRAREILASGVIGEVVSFENIFSSSVDMRQRWNSMPEMSGGGVLIDNGTHSVDVVRYLLGPIAEVFVSEGPRVQGLPVEETVHMMLRTANGVLGSVDLSWSVNREANYINIYGSRGSIHLGWSEAKYRGDGSREWTVFGKGYDKIQAFRSQLENFALAIQGRESLLISAADALESVTVIECAYQSLRQKCWISTARQPEMVTAA